MAFYSKFELHEEKKRGERRGAEGKEQSGRGKKEGRRVLSWRDPHIYYSRPQKGEEKKEESSANLNEGGKKGRKGHSRGMTLSITRAFCHPGKGEREGSEFPNR